MIGTGINVAAVAVGTGLGTKLGALFPENVQKSVMHALGLLTLLIGLQMALKTKNLFVLMAAMIVGGLVGEYICIQENLDRLGQHLQALLAQHNPSSRLSEGFVTASLVFCVGPMAILGSIEDGLTGDFRLLAVKSVLDGFAAVAFSSTMGWGVGLSVATILLYQGSITLCAGILHDALTQPMIDEMTAVGGLLIVAIALQLLDIKRVRVANFLPALILAPLIVSIMTVFPHFR